MNRSNKKKVVGERYFEELTHANDYFFEISEDSLLFYWLNGPSQFFLGEELMILFFGVYLELILHY